MPGGRIPPDGRPPQAKGVGKNSKRHDLERPKTPGLHDSDLQQGEVSQLEQGQRVQGTKQTQQPATGVPQKEHQVQPQGVPTEQSAPMEVPDAIGFLGGNQGPEFSEPRTHRQLDNRGFISWMPLLKRMVQGPGSSGLFADLLIKSAQQMRQGGGQAATIVDLEAADDGLEAMLDAGIRSE